MGRFLDQAGDSKYLNLPAVFFHEILRILCAYYFKRHELAYISDHYAISTTCIPSGIPPRSPYVDYDFVLNPVLPESPQALLPSNPRVSAKRTASELRDRVVRLPLLGGVHGVQKLLYSCMVPADFRHMTRKLNANQNGNRWGVRVLRPERARIALPHLDKQLDILKSKLAGLCTKLDLDTPGNLFKLVELWIRTYTVKRHPEPWRADLLLTGSTTTLENRLWAARAKSEGTPVVNVFHGEACGVQDEPVFGYGENTFVDKVVGYGETGCALSTSSEFLTSLFGDPITYVPSASEGARKLYTATPVQSLSELPSPRFMYVPTAFTGSGNYGPYRSPPHDVAYLQWQRGLVANIAEQFPGRVIWKQYPAKTQPAGLLVPGVAVIEKQRFEQVMGKADVFVFDYLSTAFTLAAATSKPIIYLDVGMRNITEAAMAALRDRCIYVTADLQNPQEAFQQAMRLSEKRCQNVYTSSFSIPSDPRARYEVIADVIIDTANSGSR